MNLFGNFIPHLIVVAKHLPVVGKILELPGIKQVRLFAFVICFDFLKHYQSFQVVDLLQQRGSSNNKAAAAV
jgi:hypothetical protein